MHTVRSVEQDIQRYLEQEGVLVALIQNIRAEPSWNPAGLLDARSQAIRTQNEQGFQQFAQNASKMHDVIAWFRTQAPAMRADEPGEQARLEEVGEQLHSVLPLLEDMKAQLLTTLNAFRGQRGAALYRLPVARTP